MDLLIAAGRASITISGMGQKVMSAIGILKKINGSKT